MAIVEIVPAKFEEAIRVFQNLRKEDNMEVSRLGNPTEVMTELLQTSYAYVGRYDGEPACVYGLRPPDSALDPAVLWLITTPLVEKAKVYMARFSLAFVYESLREWGAIDGWVLETNNRSQRWLSWIGFDLGTPFELPPVGIVRKFSMRL